MGNMVKLGVTTIAMLAFAGCGHGRDVCKLVDAMQDACVVIRYLGPDGEERTVRVPKSVMQDFAAREAARQAEASEK